MLPSLSTLNYLKFIRIEKMKRKNGKFSSYWVSAWASIYVPSKYIFNFNSFFSIHLWKVKQHPTNEWQQQQQWQKNAHQKLLCNKREKKTKTHSWKNGQRVWNFWHAFDVFMIMIMTVISWPIFFFSVLLNEEKM